MAHGLLWITREDENKEYDAVFFLNPGREGGGSLNVCDKKCESGYYILTNRSSL